MINDGTNEDLVAIGGKSGIQIAAGTSILVKTGAGSLVRVSINTVGTGAGDVQFLDAPTVAGDVQFLDAPTVAGSGPVIARMTATTGTLTVSGAPTQFDLPFVSGLVVVNPVNGPALYVSFD